MAVSGSRVKTALFGFIVKRVSFLAVIALVVGACWLFVLPLPGQFRNTYISENALLPGQAQAYFRSSEWHYLRGYKEEVRRLSDKPASEVVESLSTILSEQGYYTDVYHHEPDKATVYGIFRAPRGDNTEAIVLVCPWTNGNGLFNFNGIAIGLALARYLTKWSVWSKSLIFVFPPDPHKSLREWVAAYHRSLPIQAGSIEGALVLDYPSDLSGFSAIDISYTGLNGQLPNLDLINTVVTIADFNSLPTFIHGGLDKLFNALPSFLNPLKSSAYFQLLSTLLSSVAAQVTSGLNRVAGCESFSGWRIDAITISAIPTSELSHDETVYGRIIEGTLRSINNLLEHFHQSFFFYLLLSPHHFVSIGTYLPAAMSIAGAFTLQGISKWISYIQNGSSRSSILKAFFVEAAILAFTFALLSFSLLFDSQLVAQMLPTFCACIIPTALYASPMSYALLNEIHGVALVLSGMALTALATLNFSLALVVGLISSPLMFLKPGINRMHAGILLLVLNPFFIFYFVGMFTNGYTYIINTFVSSWRDMQVWTWIIVMCLWLPLWEVSAFISMANVREEAKKEVK
ncbi:hypothetical protein CANCADRAFT_30092 [Tortispora caseinolytica NRRL Y-17796]|uniref:GPI transamidase component GAA1 n=1 Tax=Tortispora caseinolytica NRRL Y-17796 TaxID=767744 RepID=A0A1E4TJ37_9ASCO|nr:hypothetical protein CANCADRAFT_30092 [Tortispora caseinolytica NRRL Y-17796]